MLSAPIPEKRESPARRSPNTIPLENPGHCNNASLLAHPLRLAFHRGGHCLLKGTAWRLTGSVGLLSDAIESFVNLAGALMALWMLTLAALPADHDHPHGHGKAEYFSSAFEGFLILLAAVSIGYTAIERLMNPRPLEAVAAGLLVSVVASVINLATARTLMEVGRRHS